MQKHKKIKQLILFVSILIILCILLIFLLTSNEKDLTIKMYKNINNSQNYTITIEGQDNEYSYKVYRAQRITDISIDMQSNYEDEKQHTTTLVTEGNAYYILHNEQEYYVLDSEDIEADVLMPEMRDIEAKEYQKGEEKIQGITYYYEEYEDISTYLMLIDVDENEVLKTRFYYKDGEISYIKNIIQKDEEKIEEIIKIKCSYEVDDSLFEIPEEYAEI